MSIIIVAVMVGFIGYIRLRNSSASSGLYYFKAGAGQQVMAAGASIYLGQPQTHLTNGDWHTLGEIAVRSTTTQSVANSIEVGWRVQNSPYGDGTPRLFTHYWKSGRDHCYWNLSSPTTCGFVQVSSTISPGYKVAVGNEGKYTISYSSATSSTTGKWWIKYNDVPVGYFPARLWDDQFTKFNSVSIFGEVAAFTTNTCSDMGNGKFGTQTGSTPATQFSLSGASKSPSLLPLATTNSRMYNLGHLTATSFRFGGPGAC